MQYDATRTQTGMLKHGGGILLLIVGKHQLEIHVLVLLLLCVLINNKVPSQKKTVFVKKSYLLVQYVIKLYFKSQTRD